MPSIPTKQPLVEFLSKKGYWVFYPRWRGAWESGGQFLQRSPHEEMRSICGEVCYVAKDLSRLQELFE
jgi:hypothetical protein